MQVNKVTVAASLLYQMYCHHGAGRALGNGQPVKLTSLNLEMLSLFQASWRRRWPVQSCRSQTSSATPTLVSSKRPERRWCPSSKTSVHAACFVYIQDTINNYRCARAWFCLFVSLFVLCFLGSIRLINITRKCSIQPMGKRSACTICFTPHSTQSCLRVFAKGVGRHRQGGHAPPWSWNSFILTIEAI